MDKTTEQKYIKIAAKILIALIILIVFICNIHIIPTGSTGVKIRLGKILDVPVNSGNLYVTIPFIEDIEIVNNKQQDFKTSGKIWGETNDKTPVFAEDLTVTYKINPDNSVWIYKNVTNHTKNLITNELISSAVKSAMVGISPEEVTNRSVIEPAIEKELNKSLAKKYGEGIIDICKVTVDNMDFEETYNNAIAARSLATQERSRVEIENQTRLSKAETDKQIAILNAEAQAEQIRIAAEAEADANKIIDESLTEKLITLKKIEIWNGMLPYIIGETNSFIDISDLITN